MRPGRNSIVFKRSLIISFLFHTGLFLVIVASPSLPTPSKKGMIHYLPLNMVSFPGGGGGGGTGASPSPPPPAKRETLRDLTTPQKAREEPKASLRYPVEKPKKEPKKQPEKKTVISKPEPTPAQTAPAKAEPSGSGEPAGSGAGSGLRIGVGGGAGGGSGLGPGHGSEFGLGGFPYVYYLEIIQERISSRWFKSLIDPGVSGQYQAVIYFRIQRNGQATDFAIEQSSGIRSFDMSALRAVQTAGPFPPLPRDFEGEYLVIHLLFEHSR